VIRPPVSVEIPDVERVAAHLLGRRHHREREGEDHRRVELVEGRSVDGSESTYTPPGRLKHAAAARRHRALGMVSPPGTPEAYAFRVT
jgi:hypothetical protein